MSRYWLSRLLLLSVMTFMSVSTLAEDEEAAPAPKAQYVELKPSFVANFGGGGKLKYLKADISLRVPSPAAADTIEAHKPLVRHEIVMLFSRQTDQTMTAPGGQEQVRAEALAAVKAVLKEETGDEQVDDLLFTSFVVQR